MRWASIALCSMAITANVTIALDAQQQQDPLFLLERIRNRLLTDLENLVRRTCVQTITRSYRKPSSQRSIAIPCAEALSTRARRASEQPVQWWDRWHLDVAIAEREIYSWAGAPQFAVGKISDFIDYGSVANGDFGPLIAGAIAGSGRYTDRGERVIEGRKLWEYSYDVPDFRSLYHFDTDSGQVTLAYEGTLLIDPASSDLVRLTASAVPPAGSGCRVITRVDYQRVRMGQRDVLVPRETEVRMVDRSGGETVIVTSYANCRQFFSESVIRFDQSIEEPEKSTQRLSAAPLPEGLVFRGRILTPLDPDTMAAGDVIAASLLTPIRDSNRVVLAPAGTRIAGRLVRVLQSSGVYEICIRFESIEMKGGPVPFGATQTARTAALLARQAAKLAAPIVPPEVGVFLVRKEALRAGQIDSEWITAPPRR